MSLANSNRASITAWLSCEAYERKVIHGQHSWIHSCELVWCCGYDATKAGTEMGPQNASLPLVDLEPTYSLDRLSGEDLELLSHALYVLNSNATAEDDYNSIMCMIDRIYAAQY